MKYYLAQVDPEKQESPLSREDFEELYDDVVIHGNDRFYGHVNEDFTEALEIAEELGEEYEQYSEQQKNCTALYIKTGEHWMCQGICGSCQSDWNYIYYPVGKYSQKDILDISAMYFNTGTEWIVAEEDYDPDEDCPNDIWGHSVYSVEVLPSKIREDIAMYLGADEDDIVLYEFDGYEKIPTYKEMEY
ncbi:hypothetical protein M2140_000062 [Clostridiales Family XIII bacterium PM5-7]